MSRITVKDLLEDNIFLFNFILLAGKAGLWHDITDAKYMKAGLLLTGIESRDLSTIGNSIIVFGFKEIAYLKNLSDYEQDTALENLIGKEPACIIISKSISPLKALSTKCEKHNVPLLQTPLLTSVLLEKLETFLDEYTREVQYVHGALIDVMGIGTLLQGDSGIGKSETALELITRGHRLVSDDTVQIEKHHPNILIGRGTPIIRHHMEIRGLGIISIPDLFGPSSIRDKKKIELVIKMEEWNSSEEYDRLGLEMQYTEILGVKIPLKVIPIRPGRSTATIIEVATRDLLLRQRGINSAMKFHLSLEQAIKNAKMTSVIDEDSE